MQVGIAIYTLSSFYNNRDVGTLSGGVVYIYQLRALMIFIVMAQDAHL